MRWTSARYKAVPDRSSIRLSSSIVGSVSWDIVSKLTEPPVGGLLKTWYASHEEPVVSDVGFLVLGPLIPSYQANVESATILSMIVGQELVSSWKWQLGGDNG